MLDPIRNACCWPQRALAACYRKLSVRILLVILLGYVPSYGDVTFTNDVFSLTIGDDGKVSSAVHLSGENGSSELITPGNSGTGWSIRVAEDNLQYNLSMTDLGGGRLELKSPSSPNLVVVVKVTALDRYLKIELESVSNNYNHGHLNEGTSGYSTWAPYSVEFDMISSIFDGNFYFFPLDYMTSESSHSTRDTAHWDYTEFGQNGDEPMGAIAVFYAEDDADHDDILLDIWGAERSLPIPDRAANEHFWDRNAASNWLNDWKNKFSDTSVMFFYMNAETDPIGDLYQAVDVAANLGVNSLYLFPDVWRGEYIPYYQSNDGLNPDLFPNGLSDLLSLRQYMRDKGVGLDFHYTAGLIGLEDPDYGGASLHSDLAHWGTGTLSYNSSEGAEVLDVQVPAGFKEAELFAWDSYAVPHYYPYLPDTTIGTSDVRVGDELLSWSSLTWTSQTSLRLSGVDGLDPDYYGAVQSHSAGDTVTFYYSPWGALVPDPTKPLFTTLAEDYATLLNLADVWEVQYDAQNSHYVPWGLWGYEKFAQIIYEKLNHPVTSGDGFGWVSWAHMEYNFKQVNQVTRPTQINQAGPIEVSQPSVPATHLDEANFLWSKTVGLNSPYLSVSDGLMGVSLDEVFGHGQWGQYAESRKLWAEARTYFTEEQRERMVPNSEILSGVAPLSHRWGDETFRIENGGTEVIVTPTHTMLRPGLDASWFLSQEQGVISPRQFVQLGDVLSVENPYLAQTPLIEVRVLPDMSVGNDGNINLLPTLEALSLPDPDSSQTATIADSVLELGVDNSSSSDAFWYSPLSSDTSSMVFWLGLELGSRTIDLEHSRGVAITVEGDNSGAELVFSAGTRDYVIPVDFSGIRTFEIPNGEVARYKTGYGFRFDTSKPMDYSKVGRFRVFLGYVPPSTSTSVKVHAIEAMKEDRSIGWVNPELTLNGSTVTVSGTVPDDCYLSYSGGATASVYDANWNLLNTLSVSGAALQAQSGSNVFSAGSSGSSSIWLETRLKVEDAPWSLPLAVATSLPIASAPYPADGAVVDPLDPNFQLAWTSAGNSNSICLGSDYTAVAKAVSGSPEWKGEQAGTSYDPGALTDDTTYYWSVDVSDGGETTYGRIWSFHVAALPPLTWDGEALDGQWSSANNWDRNVVPSAVDAVIVGQSATVMGASTVFESLEVQAGASVTLAPEGEFLSDKTLDIAGTLNIAGVFRPYGCTLNLSGSLGADISWLDVKGGTTINFTDGATFDNPQMNFELRNEPTFGFELSETGFNTIQVGNLNDGNNGSSWSVVTFNIDVRNYDIANGTSLVLMDFTGGIPGGFNPTVNVISGDSGLNGSLSFDEATHRLIFTFGVGEAGVSWDGGAMDNLWSSANNWSGDTVPTSTDAVLVGNSANVTGASNQFASLQIELNASVRFDESDVNLKAKTIQVDGTLNSVDVFRPEGCTLNQSGSLGADIGWLDVKGGTTLNFSDGASFGNPNMAFELRDNVNLGFKLSADGFTKLVAGTLYDANSGAGWSMVTFTIDVSDYNIANGTSLELMQFSGAFGGLFNPVVNWVAGDSELTGALTYDSATNQIVLNFDALEPPTTPDSEWDGGAGDGLWSTAANWSEDKLPTASDWVLVGSSATLTGVTGDFFALEIEDGASVTLADGFLSSKTYYVDGNLNFDGIFRPKSSTFNLSGSFGQDITWLDLNGGSTLNFSDGASFANTGMALELRDTVTFGFDLSASGFTPIEAGNLSKASGMEGWSAVTFNIDISDYEFANGDTVVLMDFSGDFGGSFDPTVNWIVGQSLLTGSLSFDDVTSQLILTVDGSALMNVPHSLGISTQANGGVLLQWQGAAGVSYAIDYKESLTDPDWQVIQTGISDVDGVLEWAPPIDPSKASGFYRARIVD